MKKRSLFEKIFKTNKTNASFGTQLELLNGYVPIWTDYDKTISNDLKVVSCVDVIARNCAKLSPKHIRSNSEEFKLLGGRIQKLISEQPNELDNAFNFYYKIIAQRELYNNVFIFIQRDENGMPTGLYPIKAGMYTLLEYKNDIYIRFNFRNGTQYTASYKDDIIHLKKNYINDEILGDSNKSIIKLMSLKHVLDEGIVNAIKTTMSVRGYLKSTKAMLKPSDVKEMRDQFVRDFLSSSDGTGIAGLDATTDFKEINLNPLTATDGQIKDINNDVYGYYGVNDDILQSKYTEDTWNAFYENKIEPIALEMSLEFTNKIFSPMERYHGNKIIFEANRLQYASNQTKVQVIKELAPLGVLTKNDVREIMNLSLLEEDEGNKIMQSLNWINGDIADNYQQGGNTNE